jgi:hypothetical protein
LARDPRPVDDVLQAHRTAGLIDWLANNAKRNDRVNIQVRTFISTQPESGEKW